MIVKHRFYILLLLSCCFSSSYADVLYRQRLPFTLNMNAEDRVEVTYDFAEKRGIACTASTNMNAEFAYKGKEKTAPLPIILQSDHIPKVKQEQLADVEGRFILQAEDNVKSTTSIEVSCHYLGHKE